LGGLQCNENELINRKMGNLRPFHESQTKGRQPMSNAQAADLRRHVERLATVPRPPGSAEHSQAQAYITRELEAAGFVVCREVAYDDPGFPCTNLLTEPLPADPTLPLFIVAAHYDSIPNSPGADDNASAVAALLELARWIRPRLDVTPCKARLQLVAYDLEEYGLIGSFAHARDLKAARTPLVGMISLEMLGYIDARPGSQHLSPQLAGIYPDTGDFIGVVGNEASQDFLQAVVAGMKSVPGLPVEFMLVPGDGSVLPETRLSDHSSFWDHGLPALMITDTSFFRNPHYHQATDTPATLDYEFLAKVTRGVCAAVVATVTLAG
jgi:aminopeptidase YwaD